MNLEAVAFHEAAHACVAILLGTPVASVSIDVDRHGGEMRPNIPGSREDLDTAVLVRLAGGSAEKRLSGDHTGAGADYEYVDALLRACLNTDDRGVLDEHLRRCEALSDAYVAECWHWISRVAAALIRHRTLRGDQVAGLMEG